MLALVGTASCGGLGPGFRDARPVSSGAPSHIDPLVPDPQGSTVVLARLGARTVAVVADDDEPALLLVDVDAHAVLGRTALDGVPAQVLVAREGLVLVALRDRARVAVLEPADTEGSLRETASLATGDEPYGLAETRDGVLLVTSITEHRLEAFGISDHWRRFAVDLPREPRAVLASSITGHAYVAHLAAPLLTTVDLRAPERGATAVEQQLPEGPGASVQGHALASTLDGDLIVAPHVWAFPGRAEVRTTSTYGDGPLESEVGVSAVVHEDTGRPFAHAWASPSCLLPRAAVLSRPDEYLVACADSPLVEQLGVFEPPRPRLPTRDPNARRGFKKYMTEEERVRRTWRRTWKVGFGVTGLAFDPESRRVVAWSPRDRVLGVFSLDVAESAFVPSGPVTRIDVPSLAGLDPDEAKIAEGRAIFDGILGAKVAADGRSCASCHPDGHDDGLTWATPDGPRQTPTLRGRVQETGPYGWLGGSETLRAHLKVTQGRLLGTGLNDEESNALVAYVDSMRAPMRSAHPGLERGREVFAEHCASCHSPWASFTDGERHDVGSHRRGDVSRAFDTPSLLFVGSTAPYFHDGRYPDLPTLLDRSRGSMWHAPRGGLPEGERDALLAYLRTL